jgi:hypothetical protein
MLIYSTKFLSCNVLLVSYYKARHHDSVQARVELTVNPLNIRNFVFYYIFTGKWNEEWSEDATKDQDSLQLQRIFPIFIITVTESNSLNEQIMKTSIKQKDKMKNPLWSKKLYPVIKNTVENSNESWNSALLLHWMQYKRPALGNINTLYTKMVSYCYSKKNKQPNSLISPIKTNQNELQIIYCFVLYCIVCQQIGAFSRP